MPFSSLPRKHQSNTKTPERFRSSKDRAREQRLKQDDALLLVLEVLLERAVELRVGERLVLDGDAHGLGPRALAAAAALVEVVHIACDYHNAPTAGQEDAMCDAAHSMWG